MNGIINLLKPPGISSNFAVNAVKRICGAVKAGHAGTLDPGAAGVLPILLGRTTKLSNYLMSGTKTYIAEMILGISTDTLDSYGHITLREEVPLISEQLLTETLLKYTGNIKQKIPAFSAVKQNGRPLYKFAHKGIEVNTPIKNIYIDGVELLYTNNDKFIFKITCQKGTYIRSLISDIGKSLGTCAYTSFLLRTDTGCFNINNSVTLDELSGSSSLHDFLVSPERALSSMESVVLPEYLFDIVLSGSPIDLHRTNLHVENNLMYKIFCKDTFVGIGERVNEYLKMKTMYYIKSNNANS